MQPGSGDCEANCEVEAQQAVFKRALEGAYSRPFIDVEMAFAHVESEQLWAHWPAENT